MSQENVVNALNAYDGTQPSLEKTVAVLSEEFGPDWSNVVFEKLGDLPVELKEKLDHAFNYYASLTAWNEAQSYLAQEEPLDSQMMNERLPILKHWLEFFGQPGQDLYQQLEQRYQSQSNSPSESDLPPVSSENVSEKLETAANRPVPEIDEAVQSDEGDQVLQDISQDHSSNPNQDEAVEDVNLASDNEEDEKSNILSESEKVKVDSDNDIPVVEENVDALATEPFEEDEFLQNDDTPEAFAIHKAEHEIALLDDLHAWLAARCLQLGDIELFAYPYYGMLVDLMRQVVKDIQAVLDLENQDIVAQYYPDGLDVLTRKKEAVEADIQTAVENCESSTTALIEEGMDLNKVKKALGDLDTSTEKEYLGPAPDGFELLDDKPIDEEAVKEQYKQLEADAQKNIQKQDISVNNQKNTSQSEQNGVQRKLSFSLKPKKG